MHCEVRVNKINYPCMGVKKYFFPLQSASNVHLPSLTFREEYFGGFLLQNISYLLDFSSLMLSGCVLMHLLLGCHFILIVHLLTLSCMSTVCQFTVSAL